MWNENTMDHGDTEEPTFVSSDDNIPGLASGRRQRQYLNRIERTVQMVHKFVSASKKNIQARTSPSNVVGIADRLSTTFESNRRLGTSKEVKRSRGRPTAVLAIKITCLAAPITRVNNLNVSQLKRLGLGYPDAEMTPSKRVPSKLSLDWSWEQLKNFLFESFPVLKKVQFGLFLVDKSYLVPLPNDTNSPSRIKTYMERENKSGSLFIRPVSDISALCIEELTCNLNCSLNNRSTLITPLQTSGSFDSTLPRISIRTSTVTSAEDEAVTVENETLVDRRALLALQNKEYQQSLKSDLEKEERLRADGERIEERLRADRERIEEREGHLHESRQRRKRNLPDEPLVGIKIKLKRRGNMLDTRKFLPEDNVQILQDFIGSMDDATESYFIHIANNLPVHSRDCHGTISDLGITSNTLVQIEWLDDADLSSPFLEQRSQTSSQIRAFPLIANAEVNLMENSDEELPDPGLNDDELPDPGLNDDELPDPGLNDEELPDPGLNVTDSSAQSISLSTATSYGDSSNFSSLNSAGRTHRPRRRAAVVAQNFIQAVNSSDTVRIEGSHLERERFGQPEVSIYQTCGTPTILFRTGGQAPTSSQNNDSRQILMDVASDLTEETNRYSFDEYMPDVAPLGDVGGNPSIDALQNALKEHSHNFIKPDIEDPFLMEVRRGFVLSDALELIRVSQDDLHNPLKISFSGEDGVDLGGLRREFWSLFLHNISNSVYVKGKPGRLTFQANFVAKKKKTYFHIGQLTALSIIQDGPGLPIFSDIVTDYILNGKSLLLNLEDLQDGLKDVLLKMQDCTSEAEIRNLYSSIFDEATDAGFIIPVSRFNKQHVRLLQAALIESQISTCQDELDQFIRGLELHQVLGLLRQDSYIASSRVLLSGRIKPVTVATLRKLLKFQFTTGNQEKDQKATKQGFLTFLQATKGTATVVNGIKVETKDVLMWLSGSSVIPAIGFHKPIDIDFGESTFVNTCALAVTLKVQPDLSDAVTYYTELIINSQTFGKE